MQYSLLIALKKTYLVMMSDVSKVIKPSKNVLAPAYPARRGDYLQVAKYGLLPEITNDT